jgi:hypothetical protein
LLVVRKQLLPQGANLFYYVFEIGSTVRLIVETVFNQRGEVFAYSVSWQRKLMFGVLSDLFDHLLDRHALEWNLLVENLPKVMLKLTT